jgi:hypothetical protein
MTMEDAPMLDHGEDPALDQELDGNALAGRFEALFGGDLTAVPGRCAHCGTVHMVGAMRAYTRGPGIVLRMVETTDATYVDVRGAAYLRFRRS